MFARVSTRSLASRLESGSSIRKALGSRTIARPIATRWRWPPDSALGLRSRYGSSSSSCAASRTLAARSEAPIPRSLSRVLHVARHGHVRIQGVVLEDHRDVPILRGPPRDVGAVDPDLARAHRLQTREHPQCGRLARARRPDEHHELTVLHVEAQRIDGGLGGSVIDARRLDVADARHPVFSLPGSAVHSASGSSGLDQWCQPSARGALRQGRRAVIPRAGKWTKVI